MDKDMVIAIDFDGTMVERRYPLVGKEVPGAVRVIRNLVDAGHGIVLYTTRDNINKVPEWSEPYNCVESDTVLHQAIKWCEDHGIRLIGVNCNPRATFLKSYKVYADIYIDDAALGCPLAKHLGHDGCTKGRPMVDWYAVEGMLVKMGVLSKRSLPDNFYTINGLLPLTII